MRLAALALTAVVALLLFSAGIAFAAKAGCDHDEPCFGSSTGDRIMGTNGEDRIMARSGRDYVDARGGSDVVHGESGSDGDEYAAGGLFGDSPRATGNSGRDGNDKVYGGGGRDMLYGFGGSDMLVGGGKADYIFAAEFRTRMGRPYVVRSENPGTDFVKGGLGGDHIESKDGHRDIIDCGGGKDAVWFDEGLDIVSPNCELKNIIHSEG
jgi:Ca2+-binding RTX toxin-like protein